MASLFSLLPSDVIAKLDWQGELWTLASPDIMGDTYPVTWTETGLLLTSAGDPNYGPSYDGLDVSAMHGVPPDVRLEQVNPMPHLVGSGGHGPKPSGIVATGDHTYLAIQNVRGYCPPAWGRDAQHGSDATIIRSEDEGQTWTDLPSCPMFPGARFGGPTFVQFGRGRENVRDGMLYAVSGDQWDNGCELRVGKVAYDRATDRDAWSFVSGFTPDGEPIWERWLHAAVPVLSLPRCLGLPEMVYLEAIQRFLLITWAFPRDFDTSQGADLIVLESKHVWGPFALAHYEREWLGRSVAPYCPRLPLSWMGSDGTSGWMLTSGNFNPPADPKRPYYKPNAHRFRLVLR
jgi:hypothetical protein